MQAREDNNLMLSETWLNPYALYMTAGTGLVITSVLDIKGKDIPLKIHAILASAQIIILAVTEDAYTITGRLLYAAAVFGIFFAGNLFFGLGGADTLAAASSSIGIGAGGLIMAMAALILSLPYAICRKRKGKGEYPFIPFLLAGYIISIILTETKIIYI